MNIINDLKSNLSSLFPVDQFQFDYAFDNNVIWLPKESVVPVLKHFKSTGQFDFLMCISGVDYPERADRFEVCYELFSSN